MPERPLRAVARSYFDDAMSPAHDWHHVRRVEALADRLAGEYDVDDRTLELAVWFHDVGRAREDAGEIRDHAAWGAEECERVLPDHGVPDERVETVAQAVRAHRYSNAVDPASREAELLCDADNLDALGAVGLARCFTYGGERGEVLHDPDLPAAADDSPAGATQYNHVRKKLRALPDRMYTDAGRRMAEERRDFVDRFLAQFDAEVAGRR
ncbi:HD domain-containing protein [Haloarcula litorea]|uniref:HD domain-containing protein n=1 Tax=Haloarcula litorea TaxID=3032579 RepID=UPI0023E7B692|nr:HD domain-containing protein [Halomicroarcula sp. GDY20]